MSLTIDKFRQNIPQRIVRNAAGIISTMDMFQNLDEVGDGCWRAEVEGTYLY